MNLASFIFIKIITLAQIPGIQMDLGCKVLEVKDLIDLQPSTTPLLTVSLGHNSNHLQQQRGIPQSGSNLVSF